MVKVKYKIHTLIAKVKKVEKVILTDVDILISAILWTSLNCGKTDSTLLDCCGSNIKGEAGERVPQRWRGR